MTAWFGACVSCGVGGDIDVGDTPRESVTWKCRWCDGFVCRKCTMCHNLRDPGGDPVHAISGHGVEYLEDTLCSVECFRALELARTGFEAACETHDS